MGGWPCCCGGGSPACGLCTATPPKMQVIISPWTSDANTICTTTNDCRDMNGTYVCTQTTSNACRYKVVTNNRICSGSSANDELWVFLDGHIFGGTAVGTTQSVRYRYAGLPSVVTAWTHTSTAVVDCTVYSSKWFDYSISDQCSYGSSLDPPPTCTITSINT